MRTSCTAATIFASPMRPPTALSLARDAAPWICKSCRRSTSSPRPAYSTASVQSRARPLHLAIIGSGPAGFYSAYRLLKKLPDARITMFEALPVPYGLARYGVAPDHPEVKVGIADRLLEGRGDVDVQQ